MTHPQAEIWLDPAHSFLVKRFRVPEPKGVTEFAVSEFNRLDAGIWFPMRGTRHCADEPPNEMTHWVVTTVLVNQALDPKLFEPPPPVAGTRMIDGTGSAYTFGGSHGEEEMERWMAEAFQEKPIPGASSDFEWLSRPRTLLWSTALLAMSLVLVGTAVWLKYRSRRGVS
jgi:hypothetical protein